MYETYIVCCSYYESHGMHGQACEWAEDQARSEPSTPASGVGTGTGMAPLSLPERVEYLEKALRSASQLTGGDSMDYGTGGGYGYGYGSTVTRYDPRQSSFASEKVLELQEALDLAGNPSNNKSAIL